MRSPLSLRFLVLAALSRLPGCQGSGKDILTEIRKAIPPEVAADTSIYTVTRDLAGSGLIARLPRTCAGDGRGGALQINQLTPEGDRELTESAQLVRAFMAVPREAGR